MRFGYHRFSILVLVGCLLVGAPIQGQNDATVKDKGQLGVASLRFDNFLGVVSSNLEVKAGDEAGLKFFIEGYSRSERVDETGHPEYVVRLNYSIDISDPGGVLVQPRSTGKIDTVLGMQDDSWRPSVEWAVKIPVTAPSGGYPVTIRITDEVGKISIEHSATLRVRGQNLKSSGKFEILGLEFSPSDSGPWRPIWYFERRAPVYVRYKLAGFTVSRDKKVHVEQDWSVIDSEGKEVISKPAAVVEESQEFYPPRYIESFFSVSMRDPDPGDYRIRIEARDGIGDASATAEARFVLRP